MEATTLIIFAFLVVLISLWVSSGKSSKNIPGPWTNRFPLVGSLPILTNKPFIKLTEWGKKYGPVYRLKLGSSNTIVLTDYESIKEAFSKDALMGRFYPPKSFSEETIRTKAISSTKWYEQRRFSIHMLRDLGFGKTRMEEHIQEEILEIMQRFSEHDGKPVDHANILISSTTNNIASLVFGKRLKYNDPRRQKSDSLIKTLGSNARFFPWQVYCPWIKAIFEILNIGNNKKVFETFLELQKYARKEVEEHEATLDHNNIRDFTDGYLLEIEKKKNDPNTTFKKDILIDVARSLFLAGSDTVRITMDWMLNVSAAFPEVQKRIQNEIDEVIGQQRFPTGHDRHKMPFTEAAVAELMRWRSIVPLNLMHCALEDTELKGHFIPKNSNVLAVFWSVDHDVKLWGNDVDEYKPERFLREGGRKFVRPNFLIPFSCGKRACPGKDFAEIEVFLYLTAILQKFNVEAPPGQKIDLDGEFTTTLHPKKQKLCFKQRH